MIELHLDDVHGVILVVGLTSPFKRISQGFDDSGFVAPEDFDGNAGFLRKKKLMEMVDTTQIVQDEVKKDKHTGASYTEHLIFERKHYFRTKDGRMLMPRPVECVNPSNERISLCGELTKLRQPRRNGTGSGWNIQMVFSREGAMMAAVCFPPNDEPEGNRFMENLEVGRYYVLQAYTVGESRRSPMTNNMADSVTLDWRTPIEEVPFEKIRVNTKISVEQRSFNREFQEAEEKKIKERRRDPGLFEKRVSLEDRQRTVDSFVRVSQRVDREEDDQERYGGRDLSRDGRGSTGRGRRSPERSMNPWRSTSRERGRSPRRDRIRSITRDRSTSKNSSRASRSRTKSVSRSRTKSMSRSRSRSRSRARSASVDTNPRLDESSEDAEEDNENEEKEEDTEKEDEDSDEKEDDEKGTEEDDDKEGDEEDEDEGERVVEESDSD